MIETFKMIKAFREEMGQELKNLFNSKKPAIVIDPLRAVEIVSDALYTISPDLWFRTLQIITKEKLPAYRVYRKRSGNKKGDAVKGGDAQQGTG